MTAEHFLWPQARFSPQASLRLKWASVESVEKTISDFYPGIYPVLFSSARSALTAILQAMGLDRPDLVWAPPFSSHCILEAISRVATPTPYFNEDTVTATLVYHQWGYVHAISTNSQIIEDSADSLCLSIANHFPNNGRFGLWSLPKILSAAIGGVALCRTQSDAAQLKDLRRARKGAGWLQFAMRTAFKKSPTSRLYWQGAESINGGIPQLACNDIQVKLEQLERVIIDRQEKLALMSEAIPPWLRLHTGYIPSNIPIEHSVEKQVLLEKFHIVTGSRHFNSRQACSCDALIKVLPIPIHQDIQIQELDRILNALKTIRK